MYIPFPLWISETQWNIKLCFIEDNPYPDPVYLTHWGQDKMDAMSQTTFWSAFSWMKIFEFSTKNSLNYVPYGLIDNMAALFHLMAWRRPGNKPLSEPMTGKFGDAYMHYLEFNALQHIPVLFLKHLSISASLCTCLGYEHHYSFFVYGVTVHIKSA